MSTGDHIDVLSPRTRRPRKAQVSCTENKHMYVEPNRNDEPHVCMQVTLHSSEAVNTPERWLYHQFHTSWLQALSLHCWCSPELFLSHRCNSSQSWHSDRRWPEINARKFRFTYSNLWFCACIHHLKGWLLMKHQKSVHCYSFGLVSLDLFYSCF